MYMGENISKHTFKYRSVLVMGNVKCGRGDSRKEQNGNQWKLFEVKTEQGHLPCLHGGQLFHSTPELAKYGAMRERCRSAADSVLRTHRRIPVQMLAFLGRAKEKKIQCQVLDNHCQSVFIMLH